MAHFHIKKKNGRPYLYVREIARVEGKPKVVSQVYIGSPQKVAALSSSCGEGPIKLKVEEFGGLWLANEIDRDVDLAAIVDSVIERGQREDGPSLGEYFLYCVLNRMCDAVSKNKLASWYENTAINSIRPVAIKELTSRRYWEKWDRVKEEDLEKIAKLFFKRIWALEKPDADCLLFDTTNYYTFLSSETKSEPAQRGKSKEGRDHLRQIGLGLLVARGSRLPLYYCVYPGNLHDSTQFGRVAEKMFGVTGELCGTKERLTVVVDKGMNAHGNFAWIDEHPRVHFITTYSTYFAKDLAQTSLDRFEPVDTDKNRHLPRSDQILAYRTRGHYWGKNRTVIVTYNPSSARKQAYTLDEKLEIIRQGLILMRAKVKAAEPHWRDPDKITERYLKLCEQLHLSSDLYTLEFKDCAMSFRKDVIKVKRKAAAFGKNIIITDNIDWPTSEIVEASLDRWQVEEKFRQSKDDDLVAMRPIRHFTDSKIRCHMFSCVVAMTYLRLIELRLKNLHTNRSAQDVMADMQKLHSVLLLSGNKRKPVRRIEIPTKTQAEVLSAFGHYVDDGGVLRLKSP